MGILILRFVLSRLGRSKNGKNLVERIAILEEKITKIEQHLAGSEEIYMRHIDSNGRITLPTVLREYIRINTPDEVQIKIVPEGLLIQKYNI